MFLEFADTTQLISRMDTCNQIFAHQKKSLPMKTKETSKEKEFDTVKFFRTVKERIAKETQGMTFKEFKEYLSKRKLKTAE